VENLWNEGFAGFGVRAKAKSRSPAGMTTRKASAAMTQEKNDNKKAKQGDDGKKGKSKRLRHAQPSIAKPSSSILTSWT